MESYKEFNINCPDEVKEQLIAELAEGDYEGFIEHDKGFTTYILNSKFKAPEFEFLLKKYGLNPEGIPQNEIPEQNWNAQWEAGYEPIIIDDLIAVIAPFHQMDVSYELEIIIKPKNTFGTGHHETTQLMLKQMIRMDFNDKKVLDYGCGTGVLGIMASIRGAASVLAIDIDAWSEENVAENAMLNNVKSLSFMRGDLSVVPNETYDIVLANINKNILISSFNSLAQLMHTDSVLLLSGFYENDLSDIISACNESGFSFLSHVALNNWCSAGFNKT